MTSKFDVYLSLVSKRVKLVWVFCWEAQEAVRAVWIWIVFIPRQGRKESCMRRPLAPEEAPGAESGHLAAAPTPRPALCALPTYPATSPAAPQGGRRVEAAHGHAHSPNLIS